MAKQIFGNNASSLLAASISDADLTIQVANGFGALFPNPGADEYFLVTLENDNGDIEIVKVTSRTTDLLTVPTGGRGQEGTSAQSWTNGQTRVELRLTRGTMETFIQRGGDAMAGNLDMDGNDLIDAVLSGSGTKMTAGEIVDVPLRGATGDSSNEIRVPTDGSKATAGGQALITVADVEDITNAAFVVGQVIMWYGSVANIPSGWALCNGSNGTPDLRNRFVIGAGDTYDQNSVGGSLAAFNTGASGNHSHGGATGGTVLTAAQIAAHQHYMFAIQNVGNSRRNWAAGEALPVAANLFDAGNVEYQIAWADSNLVPARGLTSSAGSESPEAHNHSIAASGNHNHSVTPPLPPFRGLYFIMFVGF